MIQEDKRSVELPPCGMFFGSGMYYSRSGYLSLSGTAFTTWLSQDCSPLELLERVASENQGNLVQLWGFGGGAPAGTEHAPTLFAQYHALEDLGIAAPPPDWEARRYLTVDDWPEASLYHDRLGAGVAKFVKAAAEKGIYTLLIYTDAAPKWVAQFSDAGKYYLGYDFGERFTFRLEEEHLGDDPKEASCLTLHDLGARFLCSVSDHIEERRRQGWGNIAATSANFYLDYEVAAGVDIPLAEDFAFKHLNMASALSRGLFRQYQLPLWGSHLAHEHYSWLPYASPYKFKLLMAAFYQKLMGGSKMIINESGTWDQQARLCIDAPMNQLPAVELGNIKRIDPALSAPYKHEAEGLFDLVNHRSPVCRLYRRTISEFYDYLKANGTPVGQPEAVIAVAKGHGDLCSGEFHPNNAVGGMYSRAERDARWFEGAPERGWETVRKVFYPRPPVLGRHPNHFLSGTPYGTMDIVSFLNDHAKADFLSAHYRLLLFAGWNTASVEQYEEIILFAKRGGTVFLSIPHLSTNATRNYTSYGVEELVNGGDFSRLCGVRVIGKGKRFYWAMAAPEHSGALGFEFPRRFGVMATCHGHVEITDPSAEVLVVEDESLAPLLIRRRIGKGCVYFLNSWAYPGALNMDDGPGAERGSDGLIAAIYRHLATTHRGTVWVTQESCPLGKGSERIAFSYFPEAGKVCLHNIDFDAPQSGYLHSPEGVSAFELAPGEFRVMSLYEASAGTPDFALAER